VSIARGGKLGGRFGDLFRYGKSVVSEKIPTKR
jgi:hypothetical protein